MVLLEKSNKNAVGLGKAQGTGLWECLPMERSSRAALDPFPDAAGEKGSFSSLLLSSLLLTEVLTEVFKQQVMQRLISA